MKNSLIVFLVLLIATSSFTECYRKVNSNNLRAKPCGDGKGQDPCPKSRKDGEEKPETQQRQGTQEGNNNGDAAGSRQEEKAADKDKNASRKDGEEKPETQQRQGTQEGNNKEGGRK